MIDIASFDVSHVFVPRLGRRAVTIAFGMACAFFMIGLRTVLDMWAPTAGPFALVYPTVLIATLFGRLLAGVTAYAITLIYAWWVVLPYTRSFRFMLDTDPPRVLINAGSAAIIVLLAEIFRRAVREASDARDMEIAQRHLLMVELEHRTKNNFALVSSLLAIQERQQTSPEASDAFRQAAQRVEIFAKAYENLAVSDPDARSVSIDKYLRDVVDRIASVAFPDRIQVRTMLDTAMMPQRKAVAIGLFVNEALTNCAKYAFPHFRAGEVTVTFRIKDGAWAVTVQDNGIGAPKADAAQPEASKSSGIGKRLMVAFAQQAEATLDTPDVPIGYCLQMRSNTS